VKENCQEYEQFRGFVENTISDFVLITEEVLKVSTGLIKKAMWKVKKECHQLGLYLC
jgi:CRISPR/Cas system CMR-associated protein Cmr5 small subunit